MPDFQSITVPASRETVRRVTIGLVDLMGAKANSILKDIGSGVTDAQINTLRTAIGSASNAGVYFDSKEVIQRQAPKDSRAFSDPHSAVSDLGVLVFKHPNSQVQDVYLDVPAIDVSFINDAGGLVVSATEIDNIIQAALPILNDSNPFTGDFYFSHGYYSDRKGTGKKYPGDIPTLVEPRGTPET